MEIQHQESTHDCVQELRLRIEALEKAFNNHWHGVGVLDTTVPSQRVGKDAKP